MLTLTIQFENTWDVKLATTSALLIGLIQEFAFGLGIAARYALCVNTGY